MFKTILAIIISVTFLEYYFLLLVRNLLKKKLDQLVEDEKKKNQTILSNLLNSSISKFRTLLDKSKLNPPLAKNSHIFFVI